MAPSIALATLCAPVPAAAPRAPVHRNAQYGIETRFAAGLRVCVALSGDQPIGFYAWLDRRTDCDSARPPATSSMNVTALYNATFEMSLSLVGCRSGAVPRGSGITLAGLAFRGLRSISCAVRREDGSFEVFVAAQGGRWAAHNRGEEFRAPLINYDAVLKTRPGRVQTDLAMFRALLANTVIHPVVLD